MFNPLIQNHQSRRLRGYDYASQGLYFITLNTGGRAKLFGEVVDGQMRLSEAGETARACWLEIPDYYRSTTIYFVK